MYVCQAPPGDSIKWPECQHSEHPMPVQAAPADHVRSDVPILELAPSSRQALGLPVLYGTANDRLAPQVRPSMVDVCRHLMTDEPQLAAILTQEAAELLEWMLLTHACEGQTHFQCPVCLTSHRTPMGHFNSLGHLSEVTRLIRASYGYASHELYTDPAVLYCIQVHGGIAEFHPVTNEYRYVRDTSYDTVTRSQDQLALLSRYPHWEHVIFGPKQEQFHGKAKCIFAAASSICWFLRNEGSCQPDYQALEKIMLPLSTLVPPDEACTIEMVGKTFFGLEPYETASPREIDGLEITPVVDLATLLLVQDSPCAAIAITFLDRCFALHFLQGSVWVLDPYGNYRTVGPSNMCSSWTQFSSTVEAMHYVRWICPTYPDSQGQPQPQRKTCQLLGYW